MEVVQSPKLLEEMERRMRFCGTCGIALGLMTGEEFDRLCPTLCRFCGGKIAPAPEKKERSLFPPEIQEQITPKILYGVLCEIFAERREV